MQSREVRDEIANMKLIGDSRGASSLQEPLGSKEKYSFTKFLILSPDGSSLLFQDAMKFYETHDGCPLYPDGCPHHEKVDCNGIWVKMGSPCWYLFQTVNRNLNK